MAQAGLFRIPFLGLMMRVSRQIRVNRRVDGFLHAMEEVKSKLRQGERVHVFPELTRCPRGYQGLQGFSAAPFLAAIQEDALVVPIAFAGTDGVWAKGEFGLNFRRPVTARTLSPLRAREYSSADELRAEVHRRIADALA